jgi:RNA polymerase sigma-70 factor (ECF subfamily)
MFTPQELDPILDEIARGNREAFRWIVRGWSLMVRSFLASQIHHLDEVEDLAQEVFVAAFRNLSSFRREEDFGAWLRGIARNKARDYFRSSARRDSALERFRIEAWQWVEPELQSATATDRSDRIERLLQCIARLPEKLRRVVHAGLDDDKPASLAAEFGTSISAIYQLHYRANQLLRQCLEERPT